MRAVLFAIATAATLPGFRVHIPGYPPTYSDNIRPFVPGYPPSFDALP